MHLYTYLISSSQIPAFFYFDFEVVCPKLKQILNFLTVGEFSFKERPMFFLDFSFR